jgi:hypothetical protein
MGLDLRRKIAAERGDRDGEGALEGGCLGRIKPTANLRVVPMNGEDTVIHSSDRQCLIRKDGWIVVERGGRARILEGSHGGLNGVRLAPDPNQNIVTAKSKSDRFGRPSARAREFER